MSDGKTPLDIVESEEEIAIFHRVFSLIDERCRELWYMVFTECLPYKEIARRLETTEEAIKTRVFRCKEEAVEIRTRIS